MATKADVDTLQDQIATLAELIERTRDGCTITRRELSSCPKT